MWRTNGILPSLSAPVSFKRLLGAALDLGVRCDYEMQPAQDQVDVIAYPRGGFHNRFNPRVGASDEQDEPARRAKREGELPQLQRTRLLRDGGNDGYARGDLSHAVHRNEMSRRPRRAGGEFSWPTAVEVPHAAGQGGIGAIERPREPGPKNPKGLLGRVDLDAGVYRQEVVQACRVVAVTVRDHHEIDGSQIDPQSADILCEDIRVVASVEEDPLPVVLHKSREAPVSSEAGAAPKGIGVACAGRTTAAARMRYVGWASRMWPTPLGS